MIYLASPYSHPEPHIRAARYKAALDAVVHLMIKFNLHVFSPIVHNHPIALKLDEHGVRGFDWDFWATYDVHYLKHSSELRILKLDGWSKSSGVDAETAIARALHMRVTFMDPV